MEQKMYTQNPKVIFREDFDDMVVLFNPENDKIYSLNKTGITIWKSLEKGATIKEIKERLQTEFENIPISAEDELLEFLEELTSAGLVGNVIQ